MSSQSPSAHSKGGSKEGRDCVILRKRLSEGRECQDRTRGWSPSSAFWGGSSPGLVLLVRCYLQALLWLKVSWILELGSGGKICRLRLSPSWMIRSGKPALAQRVGTGLETPA